MSNQAPANQPTPYASLFSSPWWLDAVAPGAWSAVQVEEGGAVVARLPYVQRQRFGLTYLVMPPLTPALGPWLAPLEGKPSTRFRRQKELMGALVDRLPRFDAFDQSFHPSVENWLPFYWKGFQQTTYYTYRLPELGDLERVYAGFRTEVRHDIKQAAKKLVVRDDLPLADFLALNDLTYTRQGLPPRSNPTLVGRLDAACAERGQRRILCAEDADGARHAAVYVVWDQGAAYLLMSGMDPAHRGSNAMALLVWEAIRHAAGVTACFDFEGSMLEPIEQFYRGFGGVLTPYHHVHRKTPWLETLTLGRAWLRRLGV